MHKEGTYKTYTNEVHTKTDRIQTQAEESKTYSPTFETHAVVAALVWASFKNAGIASPAWLAEALA